VNKPFWKSRTFWGSLIFAAVRVATATPADRPAAIGEGAGIILTAVGLRGAVSKAGSGQ
jgi:hypothetical protein